MIGRREVITLLGGAAAWPVVAQARHLAMPVIGFLNSASEKPWRHFVAAFQDGLKEKDYVNGRNLITEFRWAEGR